MATWDGDSKINGSSFYCDQDLKYSIILWKKCVGSYYAMDRSA